MLIYLLAGCLVTAGSCSVYRSGRDDAGAAMLLFAGPVIWPVLLPGLISGMQAEHARTDWQEQKHRERLSSEMLDCPTGFEKSCLGYLEHRLDADKGYAGLIASLRGASLQEGARRLDMLLRMEVHFAASQTPHQVAKDIEFLLEGSNEQALAAAALLAGSFAGAGTPDGCDADSRVPFPGLMSAALTGYRDNAGTEALLPLAPLALAAFYECGAALPEKPEKQARLRETVLGQYAHAALTSTSSEAALNAVHAYLTLAGDDERGLALLAEMEKTPARHSPGIGRLHSLWRQQLGYSPLPPADDPGAFLKKMLPLFSDKAHGMNAAGTLLPLFCLPQRLADNPALLSARKAGLWRQAVYDIYCEGGREEEWLELADAMLQAHDDGYPDRALLYAAEKAWLTGKKGEAEGLLRAHLEKSRKSDRPEAVRAMAFISLPSSCAGAAFTELRFRLRDTLEEKR